MHQVKYPQDFMSSLLGISDCNLSFLERRMEVSLNVRGETLTLDGEESKIKSSLEVLDNLFDLHKCGRAITLGDIKTALRLKSEGYEGNLSAFYDSSKVLTSKLKSVVPKSPMQGKYLESMQRHDIVFGIGPAGTGKTYLAVAMSCHALKEALVKRIILTRPAVEAGERLGFLPGDLTQKIDPYLRPLYDALFDLLPRDKVNHYMDSGIIEVAPLAFMRGRTLNDSFIILDEAQNTTMEQMKMFLTRIGFNSYAVITGDITQIDIEPSRKSGLIEAINVLPNIEGIDFVHFSEKDVVRHPLVQEIIKAYEAVKNNGRKEN